ncbi:hypothetical protein PN36_07590 [Candidatus Thiomargarita nelsonii]|uniref:Uncharacterized protein n=1 Tax=Candidatus Thiomargarita nelsonii TaxID=1003181 RepID=A0A4E0QRQ1_9GAMM|nr:hypothetical protein PN36_07590 [Candidatus Thiomargarita nelsonii]
MFNRKTIILQSIAYVVILFWGLSFSLSCYATTETITYYAFVMYKAPSAGSTWELAPKYMAKLKQGSYRFQIVRLRQEFNLNNWIALRGEFEFVPDPAGGVKLSKRETLDSRDKVNGNKLNSLWLKTPTDNKYIWKNKYSWEEAGLPWVQALIDEMKKSFSDGAPNPNLMRFLVIKNKAKSEWEKSYKKYYTLYRLHYFPDKSLSDDEALKALSCFIDPSQAPITEIKTLRELIGAQDSFEKAGYLGQADNRHKEFYKDFQKASNKFLDNILKTQAQKNLKKAEDKIEEVYSYIYEAKVQIDKAENADNKDQLIESANNKLDLAENALKTAQAEIDKAKEKIGEFGVADVQKKFDDAKANIERARQQVSELGKGIDILPVTFYLFVAGVGIFLFVKVFKKEDRRDRDDDDYLDILNHSSFQKKHHRRKRIKIRTGTLLKIQRRERIDVDNTPQNDHFFFGVKLDKPIDRRYGGINVDGQNAPPQKTLAPPIPMGNSDSISSPQPSADYVSNTEQSSSNTE